MVVLKNCFIFVVTKTIVMKRIKVIEGHLTAMEKRIIKSMLEQGLFEGCVNKINYYITARFTPNQYTITIQKYDYGLIRAYGQTEKKLSSYSHVVEFNLKDFQ